jgi:hypothetical protein
MVRSHTSNTCCRILKLPVTSDTDLLNTAYVNSVFCSTCYSLQPKKMKRRETYITHANNSLVNKNNLQASQHVTVCTNTRVRKSHACIKLGNNICYKLAAWLWVMSLKLHLANVMWSEHTPIELSTETLCNYDYLHRNRRRYHGDSKEV